MPATTTDFFAAAAAFASEALQQPLTGVARQRAVDAITDCIGCMAAGRAEPLADKLLRGLPNAAGRAAGAATMAFSNRTAQPFEAAMYNGAVAHALDYDDSSHPAYAHPSAVLVPTLLAASRLRDFSGADAVAGYIVGLELFGKLARGLNNRHYENGWHATSTLGTIAAAGAAATVLRLPRAQILGALNLATTFASGLRVHFGTMTKPLHAGMAARNGLVAAQLAREEFGCSPEALHHPYGFAQVFNWGEGRYDLQAMGRPGTELELMTDYGVSLKAFPSCGATHPGIEAAIRLHGWLQGRRIERVRIGVPALSFKPLIHHDPKTALQGKFSLEFCVAAGLLDGRVRIDTFTDARVNARDVVDLIARTTMEVDERVRDDAEWATAVRVQAEGGEVRDELVPLAIGKVGRWFTEDQMRGKFMDCTGRCLPAPRAAGLFDTLRGMASLRSFAALDDALLCD